MNTVNDLIENVSNARKLYIDQIVNYPEVKGQLKPSAEEWSVVEITEHLFWAEQGAIFGMWKTLHAIREGKIEPRYDSIHKNMPIEEIIELTWRPKEIVPSVAAPRMGGTLSFWRASLNSLQEVLNSFGNDLKNEELRLQAHPHPISGAMDFQQRLEFLRFHLNRHNEQVRTTMGQIDHISKQ